MRLFHGRAYGFLLFVLAAALVAAPGLEGGGVQAGRSPHDVLIDLSVPEFSSVGRYVMNTTTWEVTAACTGPVEAAELAEGLTLLRNQEIKRRQRNCLQSVSLSTNADQLRPSLPVDMPTPPAPADADELEDLFAPEPEPTALEVPVPPAVVFDSTGDTAWAFRPATSLEDGEKRYPNAPAVRPAYSTPAPGEIERVLVGVWVKAIQMKFER